MSKYTTELRYLIESKYPLGLDSYPIFEESYRQTLNDKILQYYMFREIGFETPALFANRLNQKMNLIMPYYNQLYKSAVLEFDPLSTIKLTTENNQKKGETVNKDSSQTGTNHFTFNSTDTDTEDTTQDTTNQSTEDTTQENTQINTATTETTASSTQTLDDKTKGSKSTKETGNNTETSTDAKNRKDVGSDTPQGLLSIGGIGTEIYASTAAIGEETDDHQGEQTHTITTTADSDTTYTRDGTGSEKSNGTSSSNISGTLSGKVTDSETGKLTETKTGKFLKTGNNDTDTSLKGTAEETSSGWANILSTLQGYQGKSPSEMLLAFRTTFLNIDAMIIAELETLFLNLW